MRNFRGRGDRTQSGPVAEALVGGKGLLHGRSVGGGSVAWRARHWVRLGRRPGGKPPPIPCHPPRSGAFRLPGPGEAPICLFEGGTADGVRPPVKPGTDLSRSLRLAQAEESQPAHFRIGPARFADCPAGLRVSRNGGFGCGSGQTGRRMRGSLMGLGPAVTHPRTIVIHGPATGARQACRPRAYRSCSPHDQTYADRCHARGGNPRRGAGW
jgi:hypothetical protein